MFYRTTPLQLFLDTVVVHLEEPDVVPPAPSKVARMWQTDASAVRAPTEAERKKAKQNMDILYNLTYEIKNLTLLITTKSNRNTVIRCNLHNMRVESVNHEWRVVDLALSRIVDEKARTETLFKLTRIKSISIAVSDPSLGIDMGLFDNAPAQYRSTSIMNLDDG